MRRKKSHTFNTILPWIALVIVSLMYMASTFLLTDAFSREIEGYINPGRISVREKTGRAWIEIDFNHGKKRLFESHFGASQYALPEALKAITGQTGISFRIIGGNIEGIGGVSAGGASSWHVYRYDTRVTEPLDRLTIAANDYYRIKFEP